MLHECRKENGVQRGEKPRVRYGESDREDLKYKAQTLS